jgi:hypothetical protein
MICDFTYIQNIINDKEYAKSKNLIVKNINYNNNQFYLIKYNKAKLLPSNYNSIGLFRSIITDGNKIISFSPQKSIDYSTFITDQNNIVDCQLEYYEEGTMINLFVNPYNNEWEISTRSLIGAKGKFFKEANFTFRYMFLETLNELGIEFDIFDKTKSYSFVLQHKENKIVIPHSKNTVFLTNVYSYDKFKVYENDAKLEAQQLGIPYPKEYIIQTELTDWETLENEITNRANQNDYKFVGVMIKNNGIRTKFRNNAYEYVKKLKGNNPKMQFQYYSLRQHSAVSECLKFYPEYKELFSEFRKNLHSWTRLLHQHYFDCFINKKAPIKSFPHQFKLHMWNLHQNYINDLKDQGKHVSLQEVIKYVNQIHPAKLMYAVNYIYRKANKDEKNMEITENLNKETMTSD